MSRIAALLLLTLASTLHAAEPAQPHPSAPRRLVRNVSNEVHRYFRDARDIGTAPLHWDAVKWRHFAEGTAAVALVYAADKPIYDAVQRNKTSFSRQFAKNVTPFGGHAALDLSALMILSGAIAHNDNLMNAGRDSLESEFFAAGIITPVLKSVVGRARPNRNEGTHSFKPFDHNYQSFPSGHSTNAFAFATAVAGHYDSWEIPTLVYTLASGVAISRIHDRAHFASDVLAGALIGRAVAKSIVFRHRQSGMNLSATPFFVGDGVGVNFHLR